MSDQEQDWIAKYRAALESERGRRSAAGAVMAAIRRVLQSVGLWKSSQATDFPVPPLGTGSPRKVAQRDVPPPPEDRDTKAS